MVFLQTLQEREAVLRIIAGSCRGRIFEAPKGLSTRPTLDRVKEAVFGSVQFQVPGAVVLDLFSGSGALALEAASRGAAAGPGGVASRGGVQKIFFI